MTERPYRVLCRDTDPEWLELRAPRLTGTGVSAIAGVNPWVSREQYFAEKVPDKDGNLKAWVPSHYAANGRYDEDWNRRKFSFVSGLRSRATHVFLESTKVPGLATTLDGIVSPTAFKPPELGMVHHQLWAIKDFLAEVSWLEGFGLLEMKQTESWGKAKYKDGAIPPHYELQVRAQLFVTGYPWAILATRIGAAGMTARIVRPRESDAEVFAELFADFRENVVDVLPESD